MPTKKWEQMSAHTVAVQLLCPLLSSTSYSRKAAGTCPVQLQASAKQETLKPQMTEAFLRQQLQHTDLYIQMPSNVYPEKKEHKFTHQEKSV